MSVPFLLLLGALAFGIDAERDHGATQIVLYCLSTMLLLAIAVYEWPNRRK